MVLVMGTLAMDVIGLLPKLPAPDETGGLNAVSTVFGGAAGNVSRALARLGVEVSLAAAVGPDFAGSAYEEALRKDGVDLAGLARVDEPTSRAFIFSETRGARQMTFFHAGAGRHIGELAPVDCDIAHFCAGEMRAYVPQMRRARIATFDPGQEVFHRETSEILAVIPEVDILFLNRLERERLEAAGFDADGFLATPRPRASLFERVLVETRGGEGCVIETHGRNVPVAAVPAQVRDPTGAGDAHRAGFLLGLRHGLDITTCGRLASTAASFAVEHVGPQEGLPDLAGLRERFTQNFGSWPLR